MSEPTRLELVSSIVAAGVASQYVELRWVSTCNEERALLVEEVVDLATEVIEECKRREELSRNE